MRIHNGKVFQDGTFVEADVVIEKDHFVSVDTDGSFSEDGLDASGCYVVPGFVDLHFHGCVGYDFCDGTQEAISSIARWQASQGTTAICPATMTYPEEKLAGIMDAAIAFRPAENEASLVGINMEGPFISPNKAGAQNPAYIQPCDAAMFYRLQERAGGLIKLVDVAPEEHGALDFIHEVASNVRISLAHTCADYTTSLAAFEAGAMQLTHTCNAMPAFLHRDPGPIGAAIDTPGVKAELIADGIHVHPTMVRSLFALFGAERIILISDSMEACGLEDGQYELGGQKVFVSGKKAQLENGTIAGSVSCLATCVQTAVRDMGIPLASAIRAATYNPAVALGIDNSYGSIAPGKLANAVILDSDLHVVNVVLRGKLLS